MICKYCNTENIDGAVFCESCGKRLDGKVLCRSCGQLSFEGNFCNFCGALLGDKKRCSKCGAIFEGDFCSVCGAPATNSTFLGDDVADVTLPNAHEISIDPIDIPHEKYNENKAIDKNSNQKSSIQIYSLIGLLGILAILVLTFFTGYKEKTDGSESIVRLYYFFSKVYSNSTGRVEKCYAVFGTIICVLLILTTVGMAIYSIYKYVKSTKSGDTSDYMKTILTTYLLYLAFILMFRCLVSYSYSKNDSVVTTITLNGITISGLVSGGVLVGISYIGNIVATHHGNENIDVVKKYVMPILWVVLITVSMVFLSGILIKYSHLYSSTSGAKKTSYTAEYKMCYIYLGGLESDVFGFGVVAQLATCFFLISGSVMNRNVLMNMFNEENKHTELKRGIIWTTIIFAFVFAFAIIVAALSQNVYIRYYSEHKTKVDNFIVGSVMYFAFLVLYIINSRVYKKTRS